MVKAKYVNTRIQNKYDTETNWSTASFTPLAGELIIFAPDDDATSATPTTYPRFKVGDGKKPINDLPLLDFVGDFNAEPGQLGYIKNKGALASKDEVSYNDLTDELKDKVDSSGSGGDMYKSDYDKDGDGVVDNAENVTTSIGGCALTSIFVNLGQSGKVLSSEYADNANNANYAISSTVSDNAKNLCVNYDSDSQPVYVDGPSLFSEATEGTGIYYATRAIGANYALQAGTAAHAGDATYAKYVCMDDASDYRSLSSLFTKSDDTYWANNAEHARSADTATTAEGAKRYLTASGASAPIHDAISAILGEVNSHRTRIETLEKKVSDL